MSTAVTTTSSSSTHLCVLIHGLWGNPSHLSFLAASMRARYPGPDHTIFVPKRNAGNATYDGIEVGAERVTREIEEEMDRLAKKGVKVNKMSICGYSLGGIVGRYAVGLLWARGVFGNDKVQPVSFTTFATPHLGVRTPLKGWHNHAWNVVGARTISQTGRQLFMIDHFRNTGKPLLAVLADPETIFMHALRQFKTRVLYANIVNDRSAVYYTTSISKQDPFTDLSEVKVNYLPGYSPVLIDVNNPVTKRRKTSQSLGRTSTSIKGSTSFLNRWVMGAVSIGWADAKNILLRVRLALFLAIFLPIGSFLFLANAALQSVLTVQRVRLHAAEGGRDTYAVPLLQQGLERARLAAEEAFESLNNEHRNEYLTENNSGASDPELSEDENVPLVRRASSARSNSINDGEFPTLALTQHQFAMIRALNETGWKKFPVHINEATHSHAAIIVRMNRDIFREGKIVIQHWLDLFDKIEKDDDE